MKFNIQTLEDIHLDMKCKFADAIYNKYIKEQYALKNCCDGDVDIEELREFILVMDEKLKLLRYNFKKPNMLYPSRLRKISVEYFYEKECYLTKCDRKFLERIMT